MAYVLLSVKIYKDDPPKSRMETLEQGEDPGFIGLQGESITGVRVSSVHHGRLIANELVNYIRSLAKEDPAATEAADILARAGENRQQDPVDAIRRAGLNVTTVRGPR